ncbi:MAG: hypothetical protein OXG04_01915 [Acidobacteria bacterium]|nr:hypothetical protein [Acidobacteriota bacterium]
MATPFLAGKGWPGDPHRFVTWWRRTHFEDSLCDRGHPSYRQIGHRAVSQVMRRAGIDHTHDEVRWLVSCIERLKPFSPTCSKRSGACTNAIGSTTAGSVRSSGRSGDD